MHGGLSRTEYLICDSLDFCFLMSVNIISVPLFNFPKELTGRSQWPRGLRRRSAAARLLRLWVRVPRMAWISVCCECCVLSGRGLCDELITRPEESYRLWCVVECDLETSWMRRPWPTLGGGGKGRAVASNKKISYKRDELKREWRKLHN
jgi:hypothetical protein